MHGGDMGAWLPTSAFIGEPVGWGVGRLILETACSLAMIAGPVAFNLRGTETTRVRGHAGKR